ncbi:MAG: methylenetetrahydrofolate reductase C-terminal domain-containing protein [Planctomycetes bacterium]|nr:methylenetetrahydrofolate reductase C-terminal domain-containing protein [Planctomycetota bacterium]
MIAQTPKPLEEILEYLRGKRKVVLYGCGGCATVFHTGGEPEVKAMEKTLTEHGKEVLAAVAPPFGEFTCYLPWSKPRLSQYREQVEQCDALLIMACGDGLQTVWDHIIEEEFGLAKPVYPATNPIGHMGGGPSRFEEKCQQCGECELGRTAGVCPQTQCAKGLMNGPCGGASADGKCEANPEQDCAWLRIYRRLEAMGELDKLREINPPKDWSKMTRPRSIEVVPLELA